MIERFKSFQIARFGLILTGLVLVVFVAWIVGSTTDLVCLDDKARTVLQRLRAVPVRPASTLGLSLSAYLLLVSTVLFREAFVGELPSGAMLVLSFLDLALCLAVLAALDFGVKYILLVAVANGVAYLPDKAWKWGFTALVVALYILLDFQLISVGFPIFSIDDFIQYHPAADRVTLFGLRNTLFSVAEVLFIVYLVLELHEVLEESQKIRGLNRQLLESRDKLAVANVQLQIYSERAEETAKVRERNRLAREIHDTVGHCLTGLSLGLAAARQLLARSPDQVEGQIGRLEQLSSQGLEDIRRSLKEIAPDSLAGGRLTSALRKMADEINGCSARRIGLELSGEVDRLGPSLEETVYRIVQEGITNAVRHGNAQTIRIRVEAGEAGLTVAVSDDGQGCSEVVEGFGLRCMRERVAERDGFLEIESPDGGGFSLSVYMPRQREPRRD
jgi:signal transduction histidine kinase